jgi:hypothetical protein
MKKISGAHLCFSTPNIAVKRDCINIIQKRNNAADGQEFENIQCEKPWMKEEKGIIHRGGGAYLRCPVSNSVQFSLRNEGSSEYIRLCEGRESLCPNFQTFQDPRHRFHGISRLVSGLLFRGLFIATYAGGNVSLEIFALLQNTSSPLSTFSVAEKQRYKVLSVQFGSHSEAI